MEGACHGDTAAVMAASPYNFDGPGGEGPAPYVHTVPMPDDYRGAHRRSDPERRRRYAGAVAETVQPIQDRRSGLSAFICESLLSCGGQIELPPGYLAAAYGFVREEGGVCIADEVQAGFGRVGSHFWGFETQSVVPEIVTMGKPTGNGHPLAAAVTTREIAQAVDNGLEYFNTFGGNPVSCAVGLAVLDVIEEEDLQRHTQRVGEHLLSRLRTPRDLHPSLADGRGRGLFLGCRAGLGPRAPPARTGRRPLRRGAREAARDLAQHGRTGSQRHQDQATVDVHRTGRRLRRGLMRRVRPEDFVTGSGAT